VPARPEVFEFSRADTERVLTRMAQLNASHVGWLNVQPSVFEEDVRPVPSLLTMFGRRSPQLTLGTWTAAEETRRGLTHETIGVQHSRAHRFRTLMAEQGLTIPDDWHVIQDAPRRGFVARLPPEPDHAAVLDWLLDATVAVSPVETTGRWRAIVHWVERGLDARPGEGRRRGFFGRD
jgi:hypothetical protein